MWSRNELSSLAEVSLFSYLKCIVCDKLLKPPQSFRITLYCIITLWDQRSYIRSVVDRNVVMRRITVFIFNFFDLNILLLFVHLALLMEVSSRQRVLPHVSACWLASLRGTDWNVMGLSGKQWTVLTGLARDLQADRHADSFSYLCRRSVNWITLSLCSRTAIYLLPFHSHCLISLREKRL